MDDQDVIVRSIGRRVKFCPEAGVMISKSQQEIESEKDKNKDELFMAELSKIANSIIPMLTTEADFPSKHPELNYKVPILDMTVWVEDVKLSAPGMDDENTHTNCKEGECLPKGEPKQEIQGLDSQARSATRLVPQVNFDFYAKSSAPKTTILSCSANPLQQKRTAFTQEVIRRLLRTRKQQGCAKKQEILSEYMQLLKNSGYSTQFRKEILKSGIKGYNKILEDDKNQIKPIYISKEWEISARRMDRKTKKKSWPGSYKSYIFVPPTPGSELRNKMQLVEKEMRPGGRENWPIKVIETAGKTLESVLVKADPFLGIKCLDPKCLPNKNLKHKILCRRNNVGYKIPCKLCPASYIGETGENMHTRAKSHLSKF